MRDEAEVQREIDTAKTQAFKDANKRKLIYADAENIIIKQEKKLESMKLFVSIVAKYNISMDDMVAIMEAVPYI